MTGHDGGFKYYINDPFYNKTFYNESEINDFNVYDYTPKHIRKNVKYLFNIIYK